jgi:hypothetical protein
VTRRTPPFDAVRANELLDYVQAGAYAQVAAESAGISRDTLEAWLNRGRKKNAPRPLRAFVARFEAAAAKARLLAETAVFQNDPRFWLKFGPGKDKPGVPGWSGEVKPLIETNNTTVNVLANPVIADLLTVILAALEAFPEARIAAAAAINSLAVDRPKLPPKLVATEMSP